MIFEQLPAGGDRNFAYLFADADSREAALVDPAGQTDAILDHVDEQGLKVKYVINTHAHADHTGGNHQVQERTGARVARFGDGDIPVVDGDTLPLGDAVLTIIHTPGHTPESICVLGDNKVCTGDTLFVGKVGGTGFGDDARTEYDSLHQKLLTLDDDVEVYPGHDYGVSPTSTIGNERRTNPFLLRETFEAFVDLKKNWLAYKTEHGIK